jgi:rhomboid protease GluP
MFGLTPALRGLGEDLGFLNIVLGGCGTLFVASLLVTAKMATGAPEGGGLFGFLSPSTSALFLFGASGAMPVFGMGRWWTPLSACWLHGGLLHIVFNMMAARNLIPGVAHLYGPGRTVLLWTIGGVGGFLASSTAGAPMPRTWRPASSDSRSGSNTLAWSRTVSIRPFRYSASWWMYSGVPRPRTDNR